MVTEIKLEISKETFQKLLELKNHISCKTREVTNPTVLKEGKLVGNPKKDDFEPTYTFDKMLTEVVDMIWFEQESGEVAYIT